MISAAFYCSLHIDLYGSKMSGIKCTDLVSERGNLWFLIRLPFLGTSIDKESDNTNRCNAMFTIKHEKKEVFHGEMTRLCKVYLQEGGSRRGWPYRRFQLADWYVCSTVRKALIVAFRRYSSRKFPASGCDAIRHGVVLWLRY